MTMRLRFRLLSRPVALAARPRRSLVEVSAMKKETSSSFSSSFSKAAGQKRGRRVSFQDEPTIHRVENAMRMSKREKQKRWVSGKDFIQSKQDCIRQVQSLQMADYNDSNNDTVKRDIFAYRGLEMVDPEAITKRRIHHRGAMSVVLNTQDKQRLAGRNKPKEIRKLYKAAVLSSLREALENAYFDRKAVVDYLGCSTNVEVVGLSLASSTNTASTSEYNEAQEVGISDSQRSSSSAGEFQRIKPDWPSFNSASSVSSVSQISQELSDMLETEQFADGSERHVIMSA